MMELVGGCELQLYNLACHLRITCTESVHDCVPRSWGYQVIIYVVTLLEVEALRMRNSHAVGEL